MASGTVGRVIGLVAIIVGWQALASVFPNNLFPFPVEIAALIIELVRGGTVFINVWDTLVRTVLGFIAAMILGVSVGVLLGINETTQRWVLPYLLVGLSISGLSSAAIGMLIFGFSILSHVFATMIAVFPYIAVNVWKGVEDIDADLLDMSQSFDISNHRMLRRVVLPDIAPALFSAYRFGLATSWKIVTVVEVFGSNSGVGHKLIQSYTLQQYSRAWAWGV
ncbi:MAG: ABC transporter permease subunit, partial [Halobacteriales archaeon]|nr:ABC transporter permease subunit [Halobacteriales archaeon]